MSRIIEAHTAPLSVPAVTQPPTSHRITALRWGFVQFPASIVSTTTVRNACLLVASPNKRAESEPPGGTIRELWGGGDRNRLLPKKAAATPAVLDYLESFRSCQNENVPLMGSQTREDAT